VNLSGGEGEIVALLGRRAFDHVQGDHGLGRAGRSRALSRSDIAGLSSAMGLVYLILLVIPARDHVAALGLASHRCQADWACEKMAARGATMVEIRSRASRRCRQMMMSLLNRTRRRMSDARHPRTHLSNRETALREKSGVY